MNHRSNSTMTVESANRNLRQISVHETFRNISNSIADEIKFLNETKKILERRISIDEQYAKSLQELSTTADRIGAGIVEHSIIKATREVLLSWSNLASNITKNAEAFRRNIVENSLKDLIEQKNELKKFFDEEKRQIDNEHRKASSNMIDAEKHYAEDGRNYTAKNNDLTKANAAKKLEESKLKSMKESINEKRNQVCRSHNEYTFRLREYNFLDGEILKKHRDLLNFQSEIQIRLGRNWLKNLEIIVKSSNISCGESFSSPDSMFKSINSINLQNVYDEIFRSNQPTLARATADFNRLLLDQLNYSKLHSDEFFVDSSTKTEIKKKIEKLTAEVKSAPPRPPEIVKDQKNFFIELKNRFVFEQQVSFFNSKISWTRKLLEELNAAMYETGFQLDGVSSDTSDDDCAERLEDEPYFHGVIPRNKVTSYLKNPGDYLVRMNDNQSIVLSVLWHDPQSTEKLRDGHFIINEINNNFSIQNGTYSKPSVQELLMFYKRKKQTLRDDGTRLIRAIRRPNFVINNDDVKLGEVLGKGNFGQVVRGDYQGRSVAVKLLLTSSSSRANFIDEALLLQQYAHKNIVKFIGLAAIRDPMMIVMELVEKGSLNSFLKSNDVPVSQLILICCDIAKGMAYLEKNNVIHRDLATRNCLVDKRNRIKVADFGLSRCLEPDEDYLVQTKEFPVRWWAVEVFRNQPYTSKSDVWSYGITAWEVFSKADMPYSSIPKNFTVIQCVQDGERLKQPDRCPLRIFQIMTTCWAESPKDRPTFQRIVENLKKERSLF